MKTITTPSLATPPRIDEYLNPPSHPHHAHPPCQRRHNPPLPNTWNPIPLAPNPSTFPPLPPHALKMRPATTPPQAKRNNQLHGFTGSGAVFQRNVNALSQSRYVVVPDLRGHGASEKPKAGYHVARLAMDLKNLIEHEELAPGKIAAVGASLGAAILW